MESQIDYRQPIQILIGTSWKNINTFQIEKHYLPIEVNYELISTMGKHSQVP